MNATLRTIEAREDGVFRELLIDGKHVCFTLEHAYGVEAFASKIPPGEYVCKRGKHELHNGEVFETFEVTGVDGHSGLLFHPGNLEKDSDGCLLTGDYIGAADNGAWEMYQSTDAFVRLMHGLEGVDEFPITVE